MIRFSPARFPAPIVRTRPIGDFVLTETRYGAGAALPTHAHEYACLVFVLQGRFAERFESKQRVAEPGMVIVRPEGEPHSDRFDAGGGRCLNVELPPRWLARVREQARAADRSAAFTGAAFPLLGRRLHEELAHGDDVSPLAVESLLLALFTEGARAERRSAAPSWLMTAKHLIHDRLAMRLTLEELAEEVRVHPVHLAVTFRRVFGVTVAAYIRQLRIEQACRALRDSDAPLVEIALAAGFADQSHFGRTFKRLMRSTPGEYRRNS
ncbi:MAG TPA: AraC family transcriptional regulator [Thermoanaerobaculia bacterium]|jgi:AraC family transcriptional regulator|nr:AraC family transcriptional regulator [Thermoanaerobaculia bacterium]